VVFDREGLGICLREHILKAKPEWKEWWTRAMYPYHKTNDRDYGSRKLLVYSRVSITVPDFIQNLDESVVAAAVEFCVTRRRVTGLVISQLAERESIAY
jgi:hypothetical protein